MRYNRKEGFQRSRSSKNVVRSGESASSLSGRGKILFEFMTRSGYVTVRSLPRTHYTTEVSKDKTSSTTKSNKKLNIQRSGNTTAGPTQVLTAPDIPEAALNASLVETTLKKLLKKNWKESKSFSNEVMDFIPSPFKMGAVHQLVSSRACLELLTEEVSSLSFRSLCNDLHEFEQSCDLFELTESPPALNLFLCLLRGPLFSWMQDVTGLELSGKVTATASKYSYTNYLLCHDDNLSDRSIAFILYLCKDWNDSDGGALQLFECDDQDQPISVVHSVYPSFGSFAFFQVTSRSYHQVQEILSKDKIRLSINGWFHGNQLPVKPVLSMKAPKFKSPVTPKGCHLEKWIDLRYLTPQYHADIKSDFSSELSVSLPEFLHKKSYKNLAKAFKDRGIIWEKCGPAHRRNYERAKLSTLPPSMQEFLKLLKSKFMFYFLSEITVDINPDSKTIPMWHLEVQRWSPGDYTLVVDNDPSSNITGIDVHLYFNVPDKKNSEHLNSGTISYLGPDKDSNGFLEQNALVEPEKNALFLVAHIAGMKRVTKYINHNQTSIYHKILATYSQG